jgi:hypothetical protein
MMRNHEYRTWMVRTGFDESGWDILSVQS